LSKAVDIGGSFAYKPSSALLKDDSIEEETAMKSKKTTKRLNKSKKLEATKALSTGAGAGKVTFNPFSITRYVDRGSS
jgi:hypothetical protein